MMKSSIGYEKSYLPLYAADTPNDIFEVRESRHLTPVIIGSCLRYASRYSSQGSVVQLHFSPLFFNQNPRLSEVRLHFRCFLRKWRPGIKSGKETKTEISKPGTFVHNARRDDKQWYDFQGQDHVCDKGQRSKARGACRNHLSGYLRSRSQSRMRSYFVSELSTFDPWSCGQPSEADIWRLWVSL